MSEKKKEPEAVESIVLVSPGGHKYEVTVSDAGNLQVAHKAPKDKGDDA